MRADLVTWILTANDTESLSAPLRDRIITIHVEPIPPDRQAAVLEAMHGQVCAEHGIVLEPLSSPVIAGLRHLGLARMKTASALTTDHLSTIATLRRCSNRFGQVTGLP